LNNVTNLHHLIHTVCHVAPRHRDHIVTAEYCDVTVTSSYV